MADHLGTDLYQLLPQRGQRPVLDLLRQSQRPHEVGEIVGQGVKLQPDGVTCYALLATGERAAELLEADDHEALSEWCKRLLSSRTDSLYRLTFELDRVLNEAGLVPRAVREDLAARLDELRPWRNALCHGAWLSVAEDGSGCLEHIYRYDGLPAGFERNVDVKRLSNIRARTVGIAIRIAVGRQKF